MKTFQGGLQAGDSRQLGKLERIACRGISLSVFSQLNFSIKLFNFIHLEGEISSSLMLTG